jgi:hypothetical protein
MLIGTLYKHVTRRSRHRVALSDATAYESTADEGDRRRIREMLAAAEVLAERYPLLVSGSIQNTHELCIELNHLIWRKPDIISLLA